MKKERIHSQIRKQRKYLKVGVSFPGTSLIASPSGHRQIEVAVDEGSVSSARRQRPSSHIQVKSIVHILIVLVDSGINDLVDFVEHWARFCIRINGFQTLHFEV